MRPGATALTRREVSEAKKDGEKAILLDLRKEESAEAHTLFFSTMDALEKKDGIFTERKN